MAHVLVTGGAGYIGAVLVPMLLERGDEVTVYDKMIFGEEPLEGVRSSIQLVQGDIRAITPEHFAGVDAVIHLAGVSNDPTAEFNPESSLDVSIRGTAAVGKAAKAAGVPRLVYASSCSIYYTLDPVDTVWDETSPVEPQATYSKGKRGGELELMKLADDRFCPVFLRKGTVHGLSPRMRYDLVVNVFARDAYQKGRLIIHNGGRMWRPVLDIRDACRAYLTVLDAPAGKVCGRAFNILSDNYRVLDIARAVQRAVARIAGVHVSLDVQQVGPTRSYRVSGDRFREELGVELGRSIGAAVEEIWADLEEGRDTYDPVCYNIAWMELMSRVESRLMAIGSVF